MKQASLIVEEEKNIIRQAIETVLKLRISLEAVDSCLKQANGFPVYLGDLGESTRVLEMLAAKHVVLKKLKAEEKSRQRNRRCEIFPYKHRKV